MQSHHGSAAGGGSSLDLQEVRAPGEVARPALAARVEQGDGSPGLRIGRLRLAVLVAVTSRASPGEFGRFVLRAPSTRGRTCSQTNGAHE